MGGDNFIVYIKGRTYMPVRGLAETYSQSKSTVNRILDEIRATDRYSGYRITINDDGDRLINVLVYEDYLYYRTELKDRNLKRRLPPFDPAEVRRNWGEYKLDTERRTDEAENLHPDGKTQSRPA